MAARGRGCGSLPKGEGVNGGPGPSVWLVGVAGMAGTNVRPIIPCALAGDARLG